MQPAIRRNLEHVVADAVTAVPGVAYLSPLLRYRVLGAQSGPPGIRIRTDEQAGTLDLQIRIAVRPGHQAAETALAARRHADHALTSALRHEYRTVRTEVIVTALT